MNSILFAIVPVIIAFVTAIVLFRIVGAFRQLSNFRKSIHDIAERAFCEQQKRSRSPDNAGGTEAGGDGYSCANCGAHLRSDTEVSPGGDFKCVYCQSWSNVNR